MSGKPAGTVAVLLRTIALIRPDWCSPSLIPSRIAAFVTAYMAQKNPIAISNMIESWKTTAWAMAASISLKFIPGTPQGI